MSREVDDYALALRLQQEECDNTPQEIHNSSTTKSSNESKSIVDDSWELVDPNPDARQLFMMYNDRYFGGKLAGVEVRWSPRMTLCAGLCCYEGRGGLCSIRLSQPLLKLRPRRDLVQTLLHEMIHAYLFVTQNNKDHDAHGPEFHKHMKRINQDAGTKITVYHNFHDEVNTYRQHWWRCDGKCRERPPFFGYVKRAMNRAPHPRDTWWNEHQQTCGGKFTKVKEPEGYGTKSSKKRKQADDAGSAKSSSSAVAPPAAKKERTLDSIWKASDEKQRPVARTSGAVTESQPTGAARSSNPEGEDGHRSASTPHFPGSGHVLGAATSTGMSQRSAGRSGSELSQGVTASRHPASKHNLTSGIDSPGMPRRPVKHEDDKRLGIGTGSRIRPPSQPMQSSTTHPSANIHSHVLDDDDDDQFQPVPVLKRSPVKTSGRTLSDLLLRQGKDRAKSAQPHTSSRASTSDFQPAASAATSRSSRVCIDLVDEDEDVVSRHDPTSLANVLSRPAAHEHSAPSPSLVAASHMPTSARHQPEAAADTGSLVACPACGRMMPEVTINTHLDDCLR
eukprot:scpid71314/ scgid3344/ Zinc finger RAD18 domain-containing protein C1orf124 homolog